LAKVTPHNPKDTPTINYARNAIFSAKSHDKRELVKFTPLTLILATFILASFLFNFHRQTLSGVPHYLPDGLILELEIFWFNTLL